MNEMRKASVEPTILQHRKNDLKISPFELKLDLKLRKTKVAGIEEWTLLVWG